MHQVKSRHGHDDSQHNGHAITNSGSHALTSSTDLFGGNRHTPDSGSLHLIHDIDQRAGACAFVRDQNDAAFRIFGAGALNLRANVAEFDLAAAHPDLIVRVDTDENVPPRP